MNQLQTTSEAALRDLEAAMERFEVAGSPVTPELLATFERFELIARTPKPMTELLPAFAVSV